MRYSPRSLDAALAEAVGDDPALVADLRAAFLSGARDHVGRLTYAASEAEWRVAAWKLQGLAATFGASALMILAEEAARGPAGDARVPALLHGAIEAFARA